MTRTLEALRLRLLLLLGRGRISFVDDGGPVQLVQVAMQGRSLHDQTPRLAEYGLSSNPPAGSDAMLVKLAGDHSQAVVVATGHQASRPTGLPAGATVLYDNQGSKVLLNADGTLVVHAETTVTVSTPGASAILTETTASLSAGTAAIAVGGGQVAITAPEGLLINGQSFLAHHHSNVSNGPGTSGGVV